MSVFVLTSGLVGCSRQQSIDTSALAARAEMSRFEVSTDRFTLVGWERRNALVNPAQGTLRIYIEGDGRSRISKYRVSPDPTPMTAVGLQLAAADRAMNVVYLARPCQFNKAANPLCQDNKWWTTHTYSADVLDAYMAVLDGWQDGTINYELVGFSGGAALVMQLAALREDVVSIRTVAGNLNPMKTNAYHRVDAMPAYYNVWQRPQYLARIPQVHYVGGRDGVIPSRLTYDVLRDYPNQSCVNVHVIPEAHHLTGWADRWYDLVRREPRCQEVFQ